MTYPIQAKRKENLDPHDSRAASIILPPTFTTSSS